MSNVALIFAGGTGKRMHAGGVPKQFLELYGKPIIIYTLEKFENHDYIDSIVISCLDGYIEKLWKLCAKFHEISYHKGKGHRPRRRDRPGIDL